MICANVNHGLSRTNHLEDEKSPQKSYGKHRDFFPEKAFPFYKNRNFPSFLENAKLFPEQRDKKA